MTEKQILLAHIARIVAVIELSMRHTEATLCDWFGLGAGWYRGTMERGEDCQKKSS